jgi:ubiquinone/menaquinone biosynthesis C-methylase UbiE
MHLFEMEGRWSRWTASLYDAVVAAGVGDLYDGVVDAFFSGLPLGSRLLDLGCGSGQVAIRIAKRNPQVFVLGCDLSQGQIARARSRTLGLSNVGFSVVDALRLPLPDDRFDFVVSVAMIKHLPDRGLGLDQMRRVCREGGSVCVIEVDKELSREATRNFVRRWRWVLPGTRPLLHAYFRRFVAGQGLSAQELRALYEDAGFSSVQVQKTQGLPFIIGTGTK